MPAPNTMSARLKMKYPKPSIDPEWLDACYDWVMQEFHLSPNQNEEIFNKIDAQLLQSDLQDSMLSGTGFPEDTSNLHNIRLASGPRESILCQINAITEIGHSAFQLQSVRQTRIDKADMAELVEAGVEDDEENAPIPRYPRSTLRLELSDGHVTLLAMEYRSIPDLELIVTPLGCKLLLRNVLVRGGIAFLEPQNTTVLADSQTEEREALQDDEFARGLHRRLQQATPDAVPVLAATAPPPREPTQVRPLDTNANENVNMGGLDEALPNTKQPGRPDTDTSYDFDDLDDEYLETLDMIESQVSGVTSQRNEGRLRFDSPSPTAGRSGAQSHATFSGGKRKDIEVIDLSDSSDGYSRVRAKLSPQKPSTKRPRQAGLFTQRPNDPEEIIEISD